MDEINLMIRGTNQVDGPVNLDTVIGVDKARTKPARTEQDERRWHRRGPAWFGRG